MQFFVLGVHGPGFTVDNDLSEAHQAYMDRSADLLVALGATRSVDGGHHTGSVHVIELPDAAEAARFAEEEPFARSGCYSTIEVTQIFACHDGTMWDRSRLGIGELARHDRVGEVPQLSSECGSRFVEHQLDLG